MARYVPTIATDAPELVTGQPGQWINYQGALGRFMGRRNGVTWIAWGYTARRRFPAFAAAYAGRPAPASPAGLPVLPA